MVLVGRDGLSMVGLLVGLGLSGEIGRILEGFDGDWAGGEVESLRGGEFFDMS